VERPVRVASKCRVGVMGVVGQPMLVGREGRGGGGGGAWVGLLAARRSCCGYPVTGCVLSQLGPWIFVRLPDADGQLGEGGHLPHHLAVWIWIAFVVTFPIRSTQTPPAAAMAAGSRTRPR
jgi:hypothetical protein